MGNPKSGILKRLIGSGGSLLDRIDPAGSEERHQRQIRHEDAAHKQREWKRERNRQVFEEIGEKILNPEIKSKWLERIKQAIKYFGKKGYTTLTDYFMQCEDPLRNIDVIYLSLAMCYDEMIRANLIITTDLKKRNPSLFSSGIYPWYDRETRLPLFWKRIKRDPNMGIDLASIKQAEIKQKNERDTLMVDAKSTKAIWKAIKSEYDMIRPEFGKKINFVKDPFKRKVIFRDVEHAFVLASQGFSKPAIILAGGVIEELLRLYLEHKKVQAESDDFFHYINACKDNGLLKRGVLSLTDSVRDFRNLVHLAEETEKRHTISKATAKGAVSSIFTIVSDFQ